MKAKQNNLILSGNLWINSENNKFLGGDRIRLLEKIEELGSITKAAKAVGICYKTAWDTVSAINNLAEKPLVDSLTGGKGGGGTCLTEEGKRIVAQFNVIQEELRLYLDKLQEKLSESGDLYTFLMRNTMKVSARNTLGGSITNITRGAVNSVVSLRLKEGVELTAVITNDDVERLGLALGMDAYAIVKASSIIVATDFEGARISARNVFRGKVVRITQGAVNTEVDIEVCGGTILSSIVTLDGVSELGIKKGDQVCALFKASDVILGVH